MKKLIPLAIVLFLLAAAMPTLFFYQGRYSPIPEARPHPETIELATTTPAPFQDVFEPRPGTLVVDLAHNNLFDPQELSIPAQRVLARGYTIDYLEAPEDLEEKLKYADALAVILPGEGFSSEEVQLIKGFEAKGGKVVLVADPTRPSQINSLANSFGIVFYADYLYNLKENDGNFRNIFLSQFQEGELTTRLGRIALYSAASISPTEQGVAMSDENTFSSLLTAQRPLSPVVLSRQGLVLALGDFTFMAEPYNSILDNNQFISNIANWLTRSQRRFLLSDFPYFFKDGARVEPLQPELLSVALELKALLESKGRRSQIGEFTAQGENQALLGLFSDPSPIEDQLRAAGIAVETTEETTSVKIEGIGEVYEEGSFLLYLAEGGGKYSLILLGDNAEGLAEAVSGLGTGQLQQWLLRDNLARGMLPDNSAF